MMPRKRLNTNEEHRGAKYRKIDPHMNELTIERCLDPPFEIIPLGSNTTDLTVIVLGTPSIMRGRICCIPKANMGSLLQIEFFLKNLYQDDVPYKPVLHEYCMCYDQGNWCRAKVVGITSDMYTDLYQVMFIDYMREMYLSSENIRRYPKNLRFPCTSATCLIKGFSGIKMDQETFNFLSIALRKNATLKFEQVTYDNEDCIEVECSLILSYLNDLLENVSEEEP